ncbi:hypothetical protein BCY91_04870 [Pelobium manganitolerans]|uniref:Serine kinase n=1 Tax=Pelobium manganitolerans TaxID=1842495 RepID=A0A419S5X7_9SPHI|nr:four-carbon acid sugar kinase family protein [Pelobium manganitolerans]RKD16213.1 hypothetical protein BCY91_04870 [Pelobium manganitolerans]
MENKRLLLAYYGDDFTGSTDALEFLTLAGVKTMLFLRAPTAEDLDKHPSLQAIGVAGTSRSLSPEEMETQLKPVLQKLQALNPAQLHYKVCSTFDSAPHVGNIGKAIEIGSTVCGQAQTFVIPAAPHLGRYCVFGNLFAKMGTSGDGEIYRLDRHPSMQKHPVTPASESDLRQHLQQQTPLKIGLVDLTKVEKGLQSITKTVEENKDQQILFFDAFNAAHLANIGEYLHQQEQPDKTLFTVGSSGVEVALGEAWSTKSITKKTSFATKVQGAKPLLVISGSCSPITAGQIKFAMQQGFAEVALPSDILDKNHQDEFILKITREVVHQLKANKDTIIHTSLGPDDPRIKATEALLAKSGVASKNIQKESSKRLGKVLGQIIQAVLKEVSLKRILFAGGDTSSYAASELGIYALEMLTPIAPGAPLCRAVAENSLINGLELNFKGGQVGAPDYFINVLNGEKTK